MISETLDTIEIEVALDVAPHDIRLRALQLPQGSTLRDAVEASGLLAALDPAVADALIPAIWGRAQPWDHGLRARDRVELTRPLRVDPKEARRQRYKRDGIKRTRPGA